ncbi:MAG: ABC transporter permease [Chlamydiia bacterium]|nr:ABC transporter permease [Chlamydiia bacterium]MCP5491727.1 ABC transporter permease [Chlamydiales bacterium]
MFKQLKRHVPFALGSPAILWQLLFFYIPLCILVISSFVGTEKSSGWEQLTLANFKPLLNGTYVGIMFSSLLLALSTACICLVIAYPLAYFIAFRAGRFKTIMLFFLIVPFWTNFLLHVSAWFFVLEREGFINNMLMTLGLIKEPLHMLNSWFAIALMMIYYYLPFMVLPIYSALERFDEDLIEASLDLGANFRRTFLGVILPLSMPAVVVGFFLVFIPAFGEFIIPEVMGGDKFYFVGSVVTQYILGETTVSLGAAFTLLSCLFLLIWAGILYFSIDKIKAFLIRRFA